MLDDSLLINLAQVEKPVNMRTSFLWLLYHKLGSLKQLKFVLSQFSRPEVQAHEHRAELKVLAGLCFLQRLRERLCSSYLPASGGFWHSLDCGCLTSNFQASIFEFLFVLSVCCLCVCACMHMHVCVWMKSSSLIRTFMILHLESTQKIQGNLHLKVFNLISSAKTLFSSKVTFTGIRTGIFGRAICSLPQYPPQQPYIHRHTVLV